MALNPDSKIPKYLQIRKWLLGMISRGKIPVGSKIPTEEELAAKFEVNRMTVRQALDELVLEKMIVRRRGEGTILVSTKPKGYIYELENISSFNDDMESHGIEPIHEVLKVEVIKAGKGIADLLELGEQDDVIRIVSVKKVDGEPVLVEKSFLSYAEFGRLTEMNVNGPFYQLLVQEFGIELHHSTQIFSAVLAGKEEKAIFGMNERQPCMKLESVIYDPNDIPIEVLFSFYRGDRYRFKATSGEYLFSNL